MQPEIEKKMAMNITETIRDLASFNWPSPQVEAWKFTPLNKLGLEQLSPVTSASGQSAGGQAHICFHDGFLVHSDAKDTQISIQQLSGADLALDEWMSLLPSEHHLTRLLAENKTEIVLISISAGAEIAQPISIDFSSSASLDKSVHPLVLISVGEGAKAKFIEHHSASNGLSAPVMIARIAQNATMHLAKLQNDSLETTHLGLSAFHLASHATLNGFSVSKGGKLARLESHVHFDDSEAQMALSAIYLGAGEQHHDITTITHHAHHSCASNQVIRGVLAEQSHGVFQGKVCVAPDAQKTDGQQMSRVLLLSRDAVADAKPELEIFADDVVCSHGATVGELDETLMFYLKSRGIPHHQARAMLIQAFLEDALEEIEDETLKAFLSAEVDSWTALDRAID